MSDNSNNQKKYTVPLVLRELAHLIARLFYEDKYVVLIDMLCEEPVIRDDTISCRIKQSIKETNKLLSRLKEERLVKCESKLEAKANEWQMKPTFRNYYYVDFQEFVNVLKYKIFKLTQKIEAKMIQNDQKDYFCPQCSEHYSSLNANRLLDPKSGLFLCENCSCELLIQETSQELLLKSKELYSRFMEQCLPIIELLKKTESLFIPAFVLSDYIDSAIAVALASINSLDSGESLNKVSNASSIGNYGIITSSIKVDLDLMENKSTQNAPSELPQWYTHSTITGEKILNDVSPLFSVSNPTRSSDEHSGDLDYENYYSKLYQNSLLDSQQPSSPQPSAQKDSSPESETVEPMVRVQGVLIPLGQINESYRENMTPEEYQDYYSLISSSASEYF